MPAAELRERLPRELRERLPDLSQLRERRPPNAAKKEAEIDPRDRLRELELDGVEAEVIYGSGPTSIDDLEEATASVRASNDWLAEMYDGYLDRFAPAASLPLPADPYGGRTSQAPSTAHIAAAAAEIRRAAALRLRPALLPDHCDLLPYNRPEWDPLWAAACEAGMPLAFHTGMGRNPVRVTGPGGAITNYTLVTTQMAETLAHLCAGGVLERFPELRVILVESGAGWLAFAMLIMDAVGIANRVFTGTRCLMWGSDYPHHEGTWPNSQELVAKQFAGVPEADIDRIVRLNAVETFGFVLPELEPLSPS
jgi:predicted TIM-barrel fold metal-dependent hydrolase